MSKIHVSVKDLEEICLSAVNDVEYGDDKDPYVKKIRRIVDKLLNKIYTIRRNKISKQPKR